MPSHCHWITLTSYVEMDSRRQYFEHLHHLIICFTYDFQTCVITNNYKNFLFNDEMLLYIDSKLTMAYSVHIVLWYILKNLQAEIQNMANICSTWKHHLHADSTEKPRLKNYLYSPKDSIYQNHIFVPHSQCVKCFSEVSVSFKNSFCLGMFKTDSLQTYLVNNSPKLGMCLLQ